MRLRTASADPELPSCAGKAAEKNRFSGHDTVGRGNCHRVADAADSAFMNAHRIGNVFHDHGAQMLWPPALKNARWLRKISSPIFSTVWLRY